MQYLGALARRRLFKSIKRGMSQRQQIAFLGAVIRRTATGNGVAWDFVTAEARKAVEAAEAHQAGQATAGDVQAAIEAARPGALTANARMGRAVARQTAAAFFGVFLSAFRDDAESVMLEIFLAAMAAWAQSRATEAAIAAASGDFEGCMTHIYCTAWAARRIQIFNAIISGEATYNDLAGTNTDACVESDLLEFHAGLASEFA